MQVDSLKAPVQERLKRLEKFLRGLGFNAIIPDWEPFGAVADAISPDLVAFSDETHNNQETAWIAVTQHSRADLDRLVPIGAPFVILAAEEHGELWRLRGSSGGDHEPGGPVQYEDIPGECARLRPELGPEAVDRAKRGELKAPLWRGIPEFYQFAADVTGGKLRRKIDQALKATGSFATDSLLLLLAAMILDDKLLLGQSSVNNATQLFNKLNAACPDLAGILPGTRSSVADLDDLFHHIRNELKFGGLTFEMLAALYRKVLASKGDQHPERPRVTPLLLARKVLDTIPLEDIPPEDRTILDPCCGSGAMLLAAQERLLAIPDMRRVSEHTAFIENHLFGADKQPVAAFTTSVALLAFGLPNQCRVSVSVHDTTSRTFEPSERPRVVLAHPPAMKKDLDAFVQRCAGWVAPGGFLGMILPFDYLTTRTVKSRAFLASYDCDLLEAWDLPGDSDLGLRPSLVLVVRKAADRSSPCPRSCGRVAHVTAGPARPRQFLQGQDIGVCSVVPRAALSEQTDNPPPSAMNRLWNRLRHLDPLGSIAEVRNGPKPWSAAKLRDKFDLDESDVFPEQGGCEGVYPFLLPSSVSLHCIAWNEQTENRFADLSKPFDRLRPAWFPRIVEKKWPKVIVKAASPAANPWRLIVALDDSCLVPRNSLHFVLPRDGHKKAVAAAIAVLLTSRLANAWVYCRNKTAQIHADNIKSIPVPVLTTQLVQVLSGLQRRLRRASARPRPDASALRDMLDAVDEECERAYGLSCAEREMLDRLYADTERAGPRDVSLPYVAASATAAPPGPEDLWTTYGEVVDVNCESHEIGLWLADAEPGSREIQCPIPPQFPGWALQPGATFEAEIDRRWLRKRQGPPAFFSVRPIGYGYLTQQELEDSFQEAATRA